MIALPRGDAFARMAILVASAVLQSGCPGPDASSPSAPIEFAAPTPSFDPQACCKDPTCDLKAFRAKGGVCPEDTAVRGPLPVEAVTLQE